MPVLALARLLGHSRVQTTQGYTDGADPPTRRSYEAAMEHQTLLAGESAATGETPPSVVAVTGPVTVVREVPSPFDGTDLDASMTGLVAGELPGLGKASVV
jgi:hypothetical protein